MTKATQSKAAKKKTGSQLISMKELEKMYASDAAEAAAAAPTVGGVRRITANDGVFMVDDIKLSDPLKCIVVAEGLLNVWYPEAYDSAHPTPPGCFAVGNAVKDGEKLLHAHPTSPQIQGGANGHDCATCEMNKFGSAEKGKGKACSNRRNLAVVLLDDPAFETGDDLEWLQLSISPTGLSAWGAYITELLSKAKRPPHGVLTAFTFNRDAKTASARKAVVPVKNTWALITEPTVAIKVNELRKTILETGALVRPLPVDLGSDEDKKPAKGKAKGKRKF
jgi:hypothetical protein